LTLRLFTRGVEFGAKILAGAVLKGPLVLPKNILLIRIALRNDLAVADIGAKYIKVSVQEATFLWSAKTLSRAGSAREYS
jgi:hypothetical protein